MNRFSLVAFGAVAAATVAFVGCDGGQKPAGTTAATGRPSTTDDGADEVAAERAKLSPEDRALVEAQEWCVVQEDERLGSMGPPIKLDIKGQPVFVCCKGCKKKAESNPEKTLARLEALKTKARAEREQRQ